MNNLLAATLDENLQGIVTKLQSLMDSFWIYIVMALAAVVVIWGAYVGIKIAIAHKNEEKINARDMVKNLIIGIVIIFVIAMGSRHIARCRFRIIPICNFFKYHLCRSLYGTGRSSRPYRESVRHLQSILYAGGKRSLPHRTV